MVFLNKSREEKPGKVYKIKILFSTTNNPLVSKNPKNEMCANCHIKNRDLKNRYWIDNYVVTI
jgi:hypothetical protein